LNYRHENIHIDFHEAVLKICAPVAAAAGADFM
jgi:hypothetical protein